MWYDSVWEIIYAMRRKRKKVMKKICSLLLSVVMLAAL